MLPPHRNHCLPGGPVTLYVMPLYVNVGMLGLTISRLITPVSRVAISPNTNENVVFHLRIAHDRVRKLPVVAESTA